MAFNRVYLIALFELRRLLATRRGLLLIAVITLVWGWIHLKLISQASNMVDANMASLLANFGLTDLTAWPSPQLAVYWNIGVYLLPLVALLFSVDVMATDRQKGTLRFWLLRSTAAELVLGRYLGKLCSLMLIVICTAVVLSLELIGTDLAFLSGLANKLPMILSVFTLICMPYIAAMMFFSILSRTPRKALLLYSAFYFLIYILAAIGSNISSVFEVFSYLLPGHGLTDLAQLHDWPTLYQLLTPCFQTLVYIVLSILVFRRVSI